MTPRNVGILACRILGIYAWLQFVSGIPYLVGLAGPFATEFPWSNEELFSQIVWALHPVLFFVAGLFLWKRAGVIAAWMVGYDIQDDQFEPDADPKRIESSELHAIAFSTLGLWLVLDTIPRAVTYGTQLVFFESGSQSLDARNFHVFATVLELGLRLGVGVWLVFGSRGLVSGLNKLCTAGIKSLD